jgi:hypothetical protein
MVSNYHNICFFCEQNTQNIARKLMKETYKKRDNDFFFKTLNCGYAKTQICSFATKRNVMVEGTYKHPF